MMENKINKYANIPGIENIQPWYGVAILLALNTIRQRLVVFK